MLVNCNPVRLQTLKRGATSTLLEAGRGNPPFSTPLSVDVPPTSRITASLTPRNNSFYFDMSQSTH